MAENRDRTPSSTLACPFCLEIFEDATLLTCGHTFCQSCLKKYDSAHQDLDNMVCPLCRKTTVLDEKRVAGLPKNIKVSGMVEEYITHGSVAGGKSKCSTCQTGALAISFCTSCGKYLCEKCHQGHQQFLKSFFKGHRVITLKEINEQRLLIDHFADKCSEHPRDDMDLFCEDCKVYVCFKCTLVGHSGHKIRNRPEIEDELQKRVENLLECCKVKQKELEKNVLGNESKRPDGHNALEKLRCVVEEAVRVKVEKLKENRDKLLNEIDEMQGNRDNELDVLKTLDRQMIQRISHYKSIIDNKKLRYLEGEYLTAHVLTCIEVDAFLAIPKDICGKDILESTQGKRFLLADPAVFDLGKFTAWITELDLPSPCQGMAPKSKTSVITAQGKTVIETHTDGRHGRDHDFNFPITDAFSDDLYCDLAFHDNKFVRSSRRYDHGWHSRWCSIGRLWETGKSSIIIPLDTSTEHLSVSFSSSGEILLANATDQLTIYDPCQQKVTHKITSKRSEKTKQAFGTKLGLVVTSTCDTDPSIVRVYDREGNAGDPLTSSKGEYLYPAVDSNDRVFVATINKQSGKVQITLYDLEGLNLRERMRCDDLKLSLGSTWCYLVSLPCNVLAFACNTKLYFMKFPCSAVHRILQEADSHQVDGHV